MIKHGADASHGNYMWYYLAGLIVLTITGTGVQYKFFHDEDNDAKDDAFAGEDEGKRCGCL